MISEAESASKTRGQIRTLRWIVTGVAVFAAIFFAVIIGYSVFLGIGRPPPGLETYLYIITGVATVAALTTIVAMLLLGVFRGFHGKDMGDGLTPLAIGGFVKGTGGSD